MYKNKKYYLVLSKVYKNTLVCDLIILVMKWKGKLLKNIKIKLCGWLLQ